MATHTGILAWEIPWIEEPGGLQSMGLKRVGHDLVTEHGQNQNVLQGDRLVKHLTGYISAYTQLALSDFQNFCQSLLLFYISRELYL